MSPQARFARDALEFRTPTTLRAVEPLSEAAWAWWPPGDSNSIAWLVWHVAEVEDNWIRDKVLGLARRFPFGLSVRTADRKRYPPKGQLLGYFQEVRALSHDRLAATSDADFDRVIHDEHFGALTVRQVWAGVATSGAWHGGQVALTRRLLPAELQSF